MEPPKEDSDEEPKAREEEKASRTVQNSTCREAYTSVDSTVLKMRSTFGQHVVATLIFKQLHSDGLERQT